MKTLKVANYLAKELKEEGPNFITFHFGIWGKILNTPYIKVGFAETERPKKRIYFRIKENIERDGYEVLGAIFTSYRGRNARCLIFIVTKVTE